MDKYEYRVKTEQMLEYMEQKSYEKAMEIADTIDWKRVKNAAMLCSVSEIYELNEEYAKSRDILFVAYDRAPGSRKVVYRLGILALKVGDPNEAMDCYEEFVSIAPKDPNQYILHYKILKAQQAPIGQQIQTLVDFKKAEYVEKWAYELAKLYHEAGMTTECLEECDDLILWFSEGKYVYQAMELKMRYKPLTPIQQEKYKSRLSTSQPKKNKFVKRNVPEGEALAAKIVRAAAVGKTVAEVASTQTMDFGDEFRQLQREAPQAVYKEEIEPEGIPEPIQEIEPEVIPEPIQEIEPEVIPEPVQEIEPEIIPEPVQEIEPEIIPEPVQEIEPEVIPEPVQEIEPEVIPEPVQEIEPEVIPAVKAIRKEASKVISPQVKEVVPERIISEEAKQQELDFDEYMQNSMENLSQELNKTEAVTATAEINVQDVIATMAAKIDDLQEQKSKDNYFEDQIKPQQVSVENLKNQIEPEEMAEVEDVEEFYDEPEENGLFDDSKENSYFDELEENDFFDEPEEAPKQLEADTYEEESYDDDFEESLSEALEAEKAPSRKAIAKAAATGKTAKLPLEEIAALTGKLPQDTGFIVTGRYDLDAQSEVGLRAGLTEEQKKLFSYFVPVRGMSEQLVDVLEQDKQCTNREGTSKTGNLLIIGRKGSGKTVLAVDVVKAIQKGRNIKQGKVAIVTGESLNRKKVSDITNKLYGGALIIEKASGMNEKTVIRLNKAMERDTGELLIVLEEQRKPLDVLLSSNKEFRRKFTSRLEVPIFINDELVTFGQTYAKENGYKIDEMGILALYSRIDVLQREDHAVTVAEVKDIMDEAVEHSQKTNMKKFVKRVFGKNTDDSDRIILTENDFNI